MIRYAITDPSTLRSGHFREDLERMAERGATMLLYRDKRNPEYARFAEGFVAVARELPFEKILLHNEPELARRLGVDGVHLASNRIDLIPAAKRFGLNCVVSTHTLAEAQKAQELGAEMITLSPLFPSPGKGEALGSERFAAMLRQIEIPVIALGGIVDEESIAKALETGAAGFASIRYFSGGDGKNIREPISF